MVYGDFKYLTRRTASDKLLQDKAFNITKNPKYDEYKRALASMAYKFFDKKTFGSGIKSKNNTNKELAEHLHKPIMQSLFIDNIWGADLGNMQLISEFNKELNCCVIDIYSKQAWVIPLTVKKGITITNAFQKILDESKRKPNKIWADKGSEFIIDQWND